MTMSAKQGASFRWLERGYALLGLLLMVGALMPLLSGSADPAAGQITAVQVTDGSLGFQVFSASLYMIALIALLPRYNEVIALVAENTT